MGYIVVMLVTSTYFRKIEGVVGDKSGQEYGRTPIERKTRRFNGHEILQRAI